MKLISSYKLHSTEEQVELEGKPVRVPERGSYIERSGALWCVRSTNPNDKNFGCYSSREEAQSILGTLHAGGPGSGCNPEVGKCGRPGSASAPTIEWENNTKVMAPFMRLTLNDHSFPYLFGTDNMSWGWDSDHKNLTINIHDDDVGGLTHTEMYKVPVGSVKEWQHATEQRPDYKQAMKDAMNAGALKKFRVKSSQYGQTGWQYGRNISKQIGFIPNRAMSGFPAPRSGGMSKLVRSPQLKGFADMGEPMAGALGHAHIDPISWFRPPSLTQREKPGEDNRVPTDSPRETNNKYFDVDKRTSRDTIEQKYKLLKRSAPSGAIPARTTAIEPHSASYAPLSSLYSSSKKTKARKLLRGSNFTAYSRRGCL